ncbi:hypothetical protein WG936_05870 [Corynebacterium sp. H127]|uniref:hypothetical protein n=1 Tax=Corynebacterium sp. H127 TaxID=3133418 RepID=UPI0030B7A691
MTTPDQAREQIHLADSLAHRASSFNPVWITYVAICAAGSFFIMGKHWAPNSLIPMILSLSWVVAFIAMIGVFAMIQPAARRGFSKRWGIMMVLWTVTWTLTTILEPTLNVAMSLSTAFLLLAVAGPIWEAIANRTVR